MLGFERNADVVTASSYAPLLNKIDGTQWSCDLINFNATHLFAHPSYYAQTMLSSSRRGTTLRAEQSGGHTSWAAVASATPKSGGRGSVNHEALDDITVKVANYDANALPVTVAVAGRTPSHISATVLTSDSPDAVNSLDAPEAVVPVELVVEWDGKASTFVVPMPAWSVAVVLVTFAKSSEKI